MKKSSTAYALWFFLGWAGAHRAYLGHWGWFVIYFFTFGGLGILWVIDLFRIPGLVRMTNIENKLGL